MVEDYHLKKKTIEIRTKYNIKYYSKWYSIRKEKISIIINLDLIKIRESK